MRGCAVRFIILFFGILATQAYAQSADFDEYLSAKRASYRMVNTQKIPLATRDFPTYRTYTSADRKVLITVYADTVAANVAGNCIDIKIPHITDAQIFTIREPEFKSIFLLRLSLERGSVSSESVISYINYILDGKKAFRCDSYAPPNLSLLASDGKIIWMELFVTRLYQSTTKHSDLVAIPFFYSLTKTGFSRIETPQGPDGFDLTSKTILKETDRDLDAALGSKLMTPEIPVFVEIK